MLVLTLANNEGQTCLREDRKRKSRASLTEVLIELTTWICSQQLLHEPSFQEGNVTKMGELDAEKWELVYSSQEKSSPVVSQSLLSLA
ncbi:hypothetical protein DV515_00006162 [Chloebia gouldiae]|uniref:Uncharacterized protein n=1 Tax=Chloebia gouldiae TaxID=44316 RepID=A0A3L8SLM0_CHLGU|nr:hypothetical protein DV515_00006162 [Chloebia gouldiae]